MRNGYISGWVEFFRRPTLKTCLVGIVLLALAPVAVAGALGMLNIAKAYRESALSGLVEAAHSVALAVESELNTRAGILAEYADIPGNFEVASGNPEDTLYSAFSGRIIRRVVRPDIDDRVEGVSFDASVIRIMSRAATTGRSEISDLIYPEGQDKTPVIAIAVPGMATARGVPVMALTLDPLTAIQTLSRDSTRTKDILIALTDGQGRIVSRSLDAAKFVGRRVPDWASLIGHGDQSGTFEAKTMEGHSVVLAFSIVSQTTGWAVVLGEPLEAFEARWRGPLYTLALVSFAALALALVMAYVLTLIVLRPVSDLAAHAQRVAEGNPVAEDAVVAASPVREFEQLRVSLSDAEDMLRRQAEAERANALELSQSERRYRALAEVGTLVFWRMAPSGQFLALTGWKDLTGDEERNALRGGWMQNVHEDDWGLVVAAWDESRAGRSLLDVEFRVKAASGDWKWVRARGVEVRGYGAVETEWVGVFEDVDERRKAQASIAHIAHHDALTGLPNRILFSERLQEALARAARGHSGAVISIDLDRFKEVNDTLGHPVGDDLLRAVTGRMSELVRATDTVARFGGDEFAIVQNDGNQPAAALGLAARLVEMLSEPYEIQGHHVVIGASAGVTVLTNETTDAERVLKSADIALYRAKEEGRGCYRFFEAQMDAQMQERRRMELDLRRALDAGQFELHYQPMINLRSRELVGFEALLRWNHPERGLMLPADFLPLAEEVGLIMPIGRWVLAQACKDASSWPEHLKVSVNLASAQLLSRSLSASVVEALSKAKLLPARLEVEIRENALIDDHERTTATLHDLKALGVRVVMDNFGSGHSSIGYLRRFPFDKVKIDGTFIRSLQHDEGMAVIRAVTGLCGSLGITTTAEGIETEGQFDVLTAENCQEGQGFYFSHPRTAAEALEICERFGVAARPALVLPARPVRDRA